MRLVFFFKSNPKFTAQQRHLSCHFAFLNKLFRSQINSQHKLNCRRCHRFDLCSSDRSTHPPLSRWRKRCSSVVIEHHSRRLCNKPPPIFTSSPNHRKKQCVWTSSRGDLATSADDRIVCLFSPIWFIYVDLRLFERKNRDLDALRDPVRSTDQSRDLT